VRLPIDPDDLGQDDFDLAAVRLLVILTANQVMMISTTCIKFPLKRRLEEAIPSILIGGQAAAARQSTLRLICAWGWAG
jgi:hypothetical protein